MKFKIGDIVKGNINADYEYCVTTSDCTGKVVKVYKDGMILLKIISHKYYEKEVGHEYPVDEDCFDFVTSNSWTGLYGAANCRQLFTIENGVPVVNNVGKDSPCYRQLCAEYEEFLKNEKEKEA
mgnify:CR=1 FL=1